MRNKKRNLTIIWLDYKKAFDLYPHEWLIKSLHLAKLPEKLIRTIEHKLHKLQEYAGGKHKNYNVTHNSFVDDLKLYASTNTAKRQLDLVTEFSKDTGMSFGDDKCAYQEIQNGKLLQCTNNLEIN